jgi:hypothetical protein
MKLSGLASSGVSGIVQRNFGSSFTINIQTGEKGGGLLKTSMYSFSWKSVAGTTILETEVHCIINVLLQREPLLEERPPPPFEPPHSF